MHRIALTYQLGDQAGTDLHHPLMALLEAVHETGSIGAAATRLGRSYRHVWGELKRWEGELGRPLVRWVKGQRAQLAPFGEKLLWAERRARARLAPQIESLRGELERAFSIAFDDAAGVIPMSASHDDALPALREWAQAEHRLHLDIQFTGSVDALAALNAGRCLLAGFHALTQSPRNSPTARVYRPMLKPGEHKLIGFARRRQGLIVARGNPLRLHALADLSRPGVRFVNRAVGSGTRVLIDELLERSRVDAASIRGFDTAEPSHRASAAAVASGSADAAFGIEAAAAAAGLDFVPLAEEQYFLVTLRASLDEPAVQALLALLASPAWHARIAAIPGYAPEHSGEVLSLRRVLPWWSYRKPKA